MNNDTNNPLHNVLVTLHVAAVEGAQFIVLTADCARNLVDQVQALQADLAEARRVRNELNEGLSIANRENDRLASVHGEIKVDGARWDRRIKTLEHRADAAAALLRGDFHGAFDALEALEAL